MDYIDVREILIKIGIKLKLLLNALTDNNRFFRLFNTIQFPLSVSAFTVEKCKEQVHCGPVLQTASSCMTAWP